MGIPNEIKPLLRMVDWVCPLVIKHGNPKSQILYRFYTYIYIYTYDFPIKTSTDGAFSSHVTPFWVLRTLDDGVPSGLSHQVQHFNLAPPQLQMDISIGLILDLISANRQIITTRYTAIIQKKTNIKKKTIN
jgi:hypothetical protein